MTKLLEALEDLYEQDTKATSAEGWLNAVHTAEKVITKAKGEIE